MTHGLDLTCGAWPKDPVCGSLDWTHTSHGAHASPTARFTGSMWAGSSTEGSTGGLRCGMYVAPCHTSPVWWLWCTFSSSYEQHGAQSRPAPEPAHRAGPAQALHAAYATGPLCQVQPMCHAQNEPWSRANTWSMQCHGLDLALYMLHGAQMISPNPAHKLAQ